MKLSIRARLLFISLGLIMACMVAAYAVIEARLTGWLTHFVREATTASAELAAFEAGRFSSVKTGDWERLAVELSRRASGRVTLLGADGRVLADSELPRDSRPTTLDDPTRPEVQAALRGERGERFRQAGKSNLATLFVAVPIREEGRIVGVARVARSPEELSQARRGLRQALMIAGLAAVLLALVMSTIAARVSMRELQDATATVRRMADGDLEARMGPLDTSESNALASALDGLGRNLSETLTRRDEQRDRLCGILDGMEEGVLVLDAEGRVALINPSLREMLLLPTESVGKLPLEVIRHAALKELLDAVGERSPLTKEFELGELKPRRLRVRAAKLLTEQAGVFAVFTDITEMRRLETLRRDFVANVSHELRTPVTAIRSAAETLALAIENDPAAAGTFAEIIDRNAERLHGLVEDLLDLSRIESRELRLNLESVNIGLVFTQVLDLFRDRAQKRQVTLLNALDSSVPPARADRRALEHILTNLVDNAVKYSGTGAQVELDAVVEGSMLGITVADNGSGIGEQHLPRLFERFYRVDAGRSRSMGGTGLGLGIVKHLVEAMGGQVGVTSRVGEGTTFHFTVPRDRTDH